MRSSFFSTQFCGSTKEGRLSVFVAECPPGRVRFGSSCFFEAAAADMDKEAAVDKCAEEVRAGMQSREEWE